MTNLATFTITTAPGNCTPETALDAQRRVIYALNAAADDINPGAVVFTPKSLTWVDDGIDEIVIRVEAGE